MNRQQRLTHLIQENLPGKFHLEIEDESQNHSRGLETHYKILCVSNHFQDQSRVWRQRFIMGLFKSEMEKGLHSVTLRLLTEEEWLGGSGDFKSPGCQGSSGSSEA